MNNTYEILFSSPPSEWQTKQIVILDWHDGPRSGLCELAYPPCCFWFQIVAERINYRPSEDALFQIYMAPLTSMDELLDKLKDLGPPTTPSWGAIWHFSTEQAEKEADAYIHGLLQHLAMSSLFVQSHDLLSFDNIWVAVPDVPFLKNEEKG